MKMIGFVLGLMLIVDSGCSRHDVPNAVDAKSLAEMGIHRKVLLVTSTANELASRRGKMLTDTAAMTRLKPLFSESGYCIVVPRRGKKLQLTLEDFVARCRSQRGKYRFDRTTLNHFNNFEEGLDNRLFADNQIFHDVEYFTIKGTPVASRESFVRQPLHEKPTGDFWQIYTITFLER